MITNKNIFFCLCSLALFALMSCNTEDSSYEVWRLDNQAAYNAVKANSDWTLLDTKDGPTGVYFRDLTELGTEIGNEYPIETASVVVNYTGKYYNETLFDSGAKTTFVVNQVVRGFGIALQHMRTGQTWEVCIPYYLGYGNVTYYSSGIQAYTTLFFKIELLQINQYP